MPTTDSHRRTTSGMETWGVILFLFFLAGLAINIWGIKLYYAAGLLDPKTREPYSALEKFWLPALMLFPVVIQIVIYLRLWMFSKADPSGDNSLGKFLSAYATVMCFGLSSYSLLWLIFTGNFMGQPEASASWSESLLEFGEVFALGTICLLILAVANCTRIITRSSSRKEYGLLAVGELSDKQYLNLCKRLNVLLKNEALLKMSEADLHDLFTTGAPEPERQQLAEIEQVFRVVSDEEEAGRRWDKLHTQVRALQRVIECLEADAEAEIYKALRAKDLRLVSKETLVEALNRIIDDPDFYARRPELFSTAEWDTLTDARAEFKDASDKAKSKERRPPTKTTRRLNRSLLDKCVMRFLGGRGDVKVQTLAPEKKENPLVWLMKLGCDAHRDRMITKGIIRFPFEMLTFFFTIFLCIGYLFGLSLAFHDKRTIKNSLNKTPALFASKEYPILPPTPTPTVAPVPTPAGDGKVMVVAANTPPPAEALDCNSSNRLPEFFFYYDSGSAGLKEPPTPTPDSAPVPTPRSPPKPTPPADAAQQLRLQQENHAQYAELIGKIREELSKGRSAYVELIGRADDLGVNRHKGAQAPPPRASPEEGPQQTYSSNYELSAARAENLKFELLRDLRKEEVDRVQIEWACLPASNDQSMQRTVPLGEQERIARSPGGDVPPMSPEEVGQHKSNVESIKNKVKDKLALKEGDRDVLVGLGDKMQKLLDEKGKNISSKSGNALYATFKCAALLRGVGVEENARAGARAEGEPRSQGEDWHAYGKKLERAITYFNSDIERANKRVVEAYVSTKEKTTDCVYLNLMDYVYFAMYTITTTGYGDIKPTTMYAKFLCTFANMVEIFFIVVFFNALLSVRGVKEHAA